MISSMTSWKSSVTETRKTLENAPADKQARRRHLARVASNIVADRYSAGSQAANATIIIMHCYGIEAAREFVRDLDHHES